jgi:heme-degrading monooxygenase HmoA
VSSEFRTGQVITVFRSRLRADANPQYAEHAAAMSELAPTMPGYVEHKTFTAEDGERLTVATFEDHVSQDAWRLQADHVAAQRAGIAEYYETYTLQVATVDKVSGLNQDQPSAPA